MISLPSNIKLSYLYEDKELDLFDWTALSIDNERILTVETKDGKLKVSKSPRKLFRFLCRYTCIFTFCPPGKLDSILSLLNDEQLTELLLYKKTEEGDFSIRRYTNSITINFTPIYNLIGLAKTYPGDNYENTNKIAEEVLRSREEIGSKVFNLTSGASEARAIMLRHEPVRDDMLLSKRLKLGNIDKINAACLPEGTPVVTPRGDSKRIEEIKKGDYILSYNEKTGEKEPDKVIRTFVRASPLKLIILYLSNKNEIILTKEHLVFVVNKGWTEASKVSVENTLLQYHYNKLSARISCLLRKGKTWEQLYGIDRAKQMREEYSTWMSEEQKRRWALPNSPFRTPKHILIKSKIGRETLPNFKGMTYEQISGKEHAELRKQRMSKNVKEWWTTLSDDEYKEICEKNSESVKKHYITASPWKLKTNAMRAAMACSRRPTRPELEVNSLLKTLCPGEFLYTGDGKIAFGRRIPDFWNINGKKKVIEVFGSYWHSEVEEEQRKKHYKKFGIDCLVLWDYELNNTKVMEEKILSFVFNPGVKVIRVIKVGELTDYCDIVYNIETEKNKNYFACGVLVHNCYGGRMESSGLGAQFQVHYDLTKAHLNILKDYPGLRDTTWTQGLPYTEKALSTSVYQVKTEISKRFKYNPLPTKRDTKIFYPDGRIVGWYFKDYVELLKYLKIPHKILDSIQFFGQPTYPFREYMTYVAAVCKIFVDKYPNLEPKHLYATIAGSTKSIYRNLGEELNEVQTASRTFNPLIYGFVLSRQNTRIYLDALETDAASIKIDSIACNHREILPEDYKLKSEGESLYLTPNLKSYPGGNKIYKDAVRKNINLEYVTIELNSWNGLITALSDTNPPEVDLGKKYKKLLRLKPNYGNREGQRIQKVGDLLEAWFPSTPANLETLSHSNSNINSLIQRFGNGN